MKDLEEFADYDAFMKALESIWERKDQYYENS